MQISLNARVNCIDGPIGKSVRIVVNPVTTTITHLTVRPDGLGESEHMVPLEHISESTADELTLDITKNQFYLLPLFESHRFLDLEETSLSSEDVEALPEAEMAMDHVFWPFVTAKGHLGTYADVPQIPHDELAIHRGAKVEATDGLAGEVAELVINPDNGHLTHLVLHKGHFFKGRDIAVPITAVDRLDEDIVYLNIDRATIKDLPDLDLER